MKLQRAVPVLSLAAACAHGPAPTASADPAASSAVAASAPAPVSASPAAPSLPPLGGVWLERLPLADGSDAFVSMPLGATTKRPIIVAAHGAGDRPEWSCGGWRGVTDAYSFIVCPHGSPFGGAYAWSSAEQLAARVDLAEDALRARYGAYIDDGPAILAGFSQGARLAALAAARKPNRYAVVALLEGAWDESAAIAPSFAKGGRRMLLACSTRGCAQRFARGEAALSRAHVDARLAHLGDFGHHMGPTVTTTMRREWRWLVRDDERWEPWLESADDMTR